MSTCRILHCEKRAEFRAAFASVAEPLGAVVQGYFDDREVIDIGPHSHYDFVFLDSSGVDVAKLLQEQNPSVLTIVLAADVSAERQNAIESKGLRVDAYIDKNLEWSEKVKRHIGELVSRRATACLLEVYEGDVVESHDGTVVVIYEVDDDMVEQVYEQNQFVDGRLPAEGARLRVRVEVTELPASDVEASEKITMERRDDPGKCGPDKLTEPIDF